METYYAYLKKDTAKKMSSVRRTKQNRSMLASDCTICGTKFI